MIQPADDLMWVWIGFWRLSNSRPQGFSSLLRIPLSEVEAYSRLQNFDYTQRQDFLFFIDLLDSLYMEHVSKMQEEQERKSKLKEKIGKRPRVPTRR